MFEAGAALGFIAACVVVAYYAFSVAMKNQ